MSIRGIDLSDPVMMGALQLAEAFSNYCKINNLPKGLVLDGVTVDYHTSDKLLRDILLHIISDHVECPHCAESFIPGSQARTNAKHLYQSLFGGNKEVLRGDIFTHDRTGVKYKITNTDGVDRYDHES